MRKIYTREKLLEDAKFVFNNYGVLTNKAIKNSNEKYNTAPLFTFEKHFKTRKELYNLIGEKDPLFNSFYDWCIQNKRQDLINRWDYELNDVDIKEIQAHSNTKRYFKCERNLHESFLYSLNKLTYGGNLKCKKCNSVAQLLIDKYGENALDIYWNYELNKKSPWEIPANANYKVYLNCDKAEYHKGGGIAPYHIKNNNSICAFCNCNPVHKLDSFGQLLIELYGENALNLVWSNKNTIDPFTLTRTSKTKVYFKCTKCEYHDDYAMSVANFTLGQRCPQCCHRAVHKNESVGVTHPKILSIWSDKNKTSPYDYSLGSSKEVWFKCENNIHQDYKRSINRSIWAGLRCPCCSKARNISMIQEKALNYVKEKYDNYTILTENDCTLKPINPKTGRRLRYDIEIKDLKLIIEIHGAQHYKLENIFYLESKETGKPKEQIFTDYKERDEYKKQYALSAGYYYLIISYKDIQDNNRYKAIIDNYIESILLEN